MTDGRNTTHGVFGLDQVLEEVDFLVNQLDDCVKSAVARMLECDEQQCLLSLVSNAQDANRKSSILAELKILLLEQRQRDGADTSVPQAVLDLVQMGRASWHYHVELANRASRNVPNGHN